MPGKQARPRSPAAGASKGREGGLRYLPAPDPSMSDLDRLRGMPEMAAIAHMCGLMSMHMRMMPLTVAVLEEAFASPAAHTQELSVFFSRLLIRDDAVRNKLGRTEGMEWSWVCSALRATVRSWFMRRHVVAALVDATVGEAAHADYMLQGELNDEELLSRAARAAGGMNGVCTGAEGAVPPPPMKTPAIKPPPRLSLKRLTRMVASAPEPSAAASATEADSMTEGGADRRRNPRRSSAPVLGSLSVPDITGAAVEAESSSEEESDPEEDVSESMSEDDGPPPPPRVPHVPGTEYWNGPNGGRWLPGDAFVRRFDPSDYTDDAPRSQSVMEDEAAPAVPEAADGAAAASEPIPADDGPASAALAPTTDADSDAPGDGGYGHKAGRKRRRTELDDLRAGVVAVDAVLPRSTSPTVPPNALPLAARPDLPVTATAAVGRNLSPQAIIQASKEAREAEQARITASEAQPAGMLWTTRSSVRKEGEQEHAGDGAANADGAAAGEQAQDTAEAEKPSLGSEAEFTLTEEELLDALIDSFDEADEVDIAELYEWDVLLDKIGGPHHDPLAHKDWAQLPVDMRVKVIAAIIEARTAQPGDALRKILEGGKVPPEMLRLSRVARDMEGTTYWAFPEGIHDDSLRVYTERVVKLASGRKVSVWETVVTCLEDLQALLAQHQQVISQLPRGTRGLAGERALVARLQRMEAGIDDAVHTAATRAERDQKRYEKAQMLAALPRRISDRVARSPDGDVSDAPSVKAEEPDRRRTGVTYGDDHGVNLLAMDRARALAVVDRMGHIDRVRALADLLACLPEHERFVGIPVCVHPRRHISDVVREALLSEYSKFSRDLARRRARAERDRNRAERERKTAEQRAAEIAAREEERRRNEEKLSKERFARSMRRELGLASSAVPQGADPMLYQPSGIRLRMRVLRRLVGGGVVGYGELVCMAEHNPLDPQTLEPLCFPVEAFMHDTLGFDSLSSPEVRNRYWDFKRPERFFAFEATHDPPADGAVTADQEAAPAAPRKSATPRPRAPRKRVSLMSSEVAAAEPGEPASTDAQDVTQASAPAPLPPAPAPASAHGAQLAAPPAVAPPAPPAAAQQPFVPTQTHPYHYSAAPALSPQQVFASAQSYVQTSPLTAAPTSMPMSWPSYAGAPQQHAFPNAPYSQLPGVPGGYTGAPQHVAYVHPSYYAVPPPAASSASSSAHLPPSSGVP